MNIPAFIITKRIILFSSLVTLFFTFIGCKEHECPASLVKQVVLQGADITDVNLNSHYPSLNRGSDPRIQTAAWTYSGSFGATRVYMNFNLSSIPHDATITKAELTLYADTTNDMSTSPLVSGHSSFTGSNSWKIKRVTSDWNENTVTWATRPTYDGIGAISMPQSLTNDQTYIVDIASLLNDQLRNPALYYGVMFQLDTEVEYRVISFCSKEHQYAATLKPTLKITYKE